MRSGMYLGNCAAAGSPAFSPKSIAGLQAWWDPSNLATITSSGGLASAIADLSGNGYTAANADSAHQPQTGAAAVNGLNVLTQNGGGNSALLLSGAGLSLGDSLTQFSYGFIYEPSGSGILLFISASAGGAFFRISMYAATSFFTGFFDESDNIFQSGLSLASGASFCLVIYDGATFTFRVNGAQVFAKAASGSGTGATPSTVVSLGAQYTGASYSSPYGGLIGEGVFYNVAFTPTQVGLLEAYISNKWKVF